MAGTRAAVLRRPLLTHRHSSSVPGTSGAGRTPPSMDEAIVFARKSKLRREAMELAGTAPRIDRELLDTAAASLEECLAESTGLVALSACELKWSSEVA
eukprot:CAMPEP_0181223172 /NCGR_PEP_ID=MMETSP1096-20121128/30365_1 /TAXON_ID=156174 ORGANISM="Chrysochromulina ericina, Strain CCMP281" /NCGR_SAMPLE_ID=MMETSP1096 /ASSEMBLY_ACC=CAM_ASM_000453 /LENGTH=98 /DNA_ID=CAMNT_0023315997 /DNA_START=78 /DNA_END=374 /DNA_ORIENTATION=-